MKPQQESREWASVIKVLEDPLCYMRTNPGPPLRHWQHLHDRTGGSTAGLAELIHQAAIHACYTGIEEITQKLMDKIVINDCATARYQTALKRRVKAAIGRKDHDKSAEPAAEWQATCPPG